LPAAVARLTMAVVPTVVERVTLGTRRVHGSTTLQRMYLAGPDVFAAGALEIGDLKKQVCARHGMAGVYPSDLVKLDPQLSPRDQALAIYDVLERAMHDCDGAFVDLTPFRSPSMDVGTAFEMGYMKALGKPVFAYSNHASPFSTRVVAHFGGHVRMRPDGSREAADGMAIEEFDMADNLMLDGGASRSTGVLVTADASDRAAMLANFERCVIAARAWFAARAAS
jgi:nucleoside 2-deoxyribosyltransferase